MLVHMNTDDEHRRDNQVAQEEEGEGEGTCSAAANSLRPTQREEQSSQQAIVERLDVESMTSAAKPETDTSSQAITTSESSADRALGGGEDQRNERAPEELVAERGYKEQELESGCSRASETIITSTQKRPIADKRIDVRLLVRRREAGALIGKRGANIKRMRETYNTSTFNIPDTGNGPERIVCISANNWESAEAILLEIGQLFLDKSSLTHQDEEQVELKQLINSAYAGLLIGIGGQSIRKLRNDSRAAIKIYEMCCPQSEERVCAIKARPPVVVSTIRAIYEIMLSNQTTIKAPLQANKPYDALNFDLNLVDKYGGFVPDECCPNIELMDQLRSNNSAIEGPNSSQLQHYHHRPNIQPPNHHHHPHQLEHFDLMLASGGGGEPLPLVMPPHTPGFRPAAFLAPFQQIDFVPFHPVADGRKLTSVNLSNDRTRPAHNHRSSQLASNNNNNINYRYHQQQHQHQQRVPSSLQAYRNQRFQPYLYGDNLHTTRLRYFHHQQQQLMLNSQFMNRMSQPPVNQSVGPQLVNYNGVASAFHQQQQQKKKKFDSAACQQRNGFSSAHHDGSPYNKHYHNDISKFYQSADHQSPKKPAAECATCLASTNSKTALPTSCTETVPAVKVGLARAIGNMCRFNEVNDCVGTNKTHDPRSE